MLVALTFQAQDGTLVTIIDTTLDTNLLALFQVQLLGLKVGDLLLSDIGEFDESLHGIIRHRQIFLLVREGRFAHINALARLMLDILLQRLLGSTNKNQSRDGRHHRTLLLAAHGFYLIFHRYVTAESCFSQCIPHFLFVVYTQASQHIPFLYIIISFCHR